MSDSFKLVVVGSGGVGKTAFIRRIRTGDFEKRYLATIGVECSKIKYSLSNNREVTLDVWDTAGQEKFAGLSDGYYIGANCAIVMFSLDGKSSFDAISKWVTALKRVQPNIPIVLCGNKCDLNEEDRVVTHDMIRCIKEDLNVLYYDVSAKTNYNYEKPFLALIRECLSDPTITFVESAPIFPAECLSDMESQYISNDDEDEGELHCETCQCFGH